MTIDQLNKQFGIEGQVHFSEGTGSLPIVTISNEFATATISLYGGHVLTYQPIDAKNILWMSELSAFEKGKPIRGGVPVCFPWFGPHAEDVQKPQHGFARLLVWDFKSANVLSNKATEVKLTLSANDETKKLWPYDFTATLTVTVGDKLNIKLSVKNTGSETFTYTDALHSYFNVSDLNNILIEGLHQEEYYEAGSNEQKKQENELLAITKEENRRYMNHSGKCIIQDSGFERKIAVHKTNSHTTVVWNPGADTTKNIGDISDEGFRKFICVEAANAFKDIITVDGGDEYSMSTSFELLPFQKGS